MASKGGYQQGLGQNTASSHITRDDMVHYVSHKELNRVYLAVIGIFISLLGILGGLYAYTTPTLIEASENWKRIDQLQRSIEELPSKQCPQAPARVQK